MKINARGLHTVGLRIVLLAAVAHTMWGDGQGGKNRLEKKKKHVKNINKLTQATRVGSLCHGTHGHQRKIVKKKKRFFFICQRPNWVDVGCLAGNQIYVKIVSPLLSPSGISLHSSRMMKKHLQVEMQAISTCARVQR